jgi:hypothetical protein
MDRPRIRDAVDEDEEQGTGGYVALKVFSFQKPVGLEIFHKCRARLKTRRFLWL